MWYIILTLYFVYNIILVISHTMCDFIVFYLYLPNWTPSENTYM